MAFKRKAKKAIMRLAYLISEQEAEIPLTVICVRC